MTVRKIEHTGIMVTNLEKSTDFYVQVLGLESKGVLQHNDPTIRLGFLGFAGSDDGVLELIERPNGTFPSDGRVHHLAFTVDDVEQEHRRLQGLGVTFTDESITTLSNGARYIFFKGPDGENLELFQPGK